MKSDKYFRYFWALFPILFVAGLIFSILAFNWTEECMEQCEEKDDQYVVEMCKANCMDKY